MELLDGSPLRKAKIGSSVHSDFSIAPWLLTDPLEYIVIVVCVVFKRMKYSFGFSFTTIENHKTGITVSGGCFSSSHHPLLVFRRIAIDPQHNGHRLRDIFRNNKNA